MDRNGLVLIQGNGMTLSQGHWIKVTMDIVGLVLSGFTGPKDISWPRVKVTIFVVVLSLSAACRAYNYAPLWKRGGILFCTCRIGRMVCRPCVVRSISFDPFAWFQPNLVQRLPLESRWSLLIFRSHGQRSRGQCVDCRSVDHVRSISFDPFAWIQPNLVQRLPLERRWSLLIFRSHGQRSRSRGQCVDCRSLDHVRSISFDPFAWFQPNLVQGLPLESRWSLLIFRSHVQRWRGQCVDCRSVHHVRSISFDPFAWIQPNLVQRLPLERRWSLLIFRSHGQRSRSRGQCVDCRSLDHVRSISFDPFAWFQPNLVQRLPLDSRWSLLIFRSHGQRSRGQCVDCRSVDHVLSAQYLDPFAWFQPNLVQGLTLESRIPIDFQVTRSKV